VTRNPRLAASMRVAAASAVAFAALAVPASALATPSDADFLPMKVGGRWTYVSSDGHEVSETVRGAVDVRGADGSVVGQAAAIDAADGGEFYYLRTETGVVRFYDPPSNVADQDHATWVLRFPLRLGEHWESWTPAGKVEFRVTERRSITAPDGSLADAIRIDFSSLPEPIFTGHLLYARGFGPIEVVEGDYTRKLLGYRAGNGATIAVAPRIAGLEPPSVAETWRVGKKGWFAVLLTLVMASAIALLPRLKRKPGGYRPWEENERELLEEDGELAVQAARLEASVAAHPSYADLRCKLGTVYLVMDRPEDAVAQFREALVRNPGYVEASLGLTRSLQKLSQFADAKAAIAPVAEKHPTYADVQNLLGECIAELGDIAGGLACFRRALEINARFSAAQHNIAKWSALDTAVPASVPSDAQKGGNVQV
jgi:tetratricopeptide (TPR) repeat protein